LAVAPRHPMDGTSIISSRMDGTSIGLETSSAASDAGRRERPPADIPSDWDDG